MIFGISNEFVTQVLVALGLNLMQIFSAYILTVFLFRKEKISLMRVIVTSAFLYIASILLILQLLGMIGILYFNYLVISVILVFVASLALYFFYLKRRRNLTLSWSNYLPSEFKNVFFWSFVGVLVFVIVVKYFIASVQIVTESDSLVYHMPFVARWYQLGHIWEPYFTAYAGPLGYYPSNYELFLLWFVLPFHGDVMVNLVNFFLYPFFFILFYLVLRQFTVRYDIALLITFVGSSVPVLLRQLGIPQNDLFFMLFFLYSIYFLFSYLRHRRGLYLALMGLSLGVFFGTKYTGVPGAIPLFILAMASLIWVARHKRRGGRHFLRFFALFVLLFLLGGGVWYLRNFISTGNPFFPIDVSVLGIKIFSGYNGLTDKVFEQALISHIPEAHLFDRLVEAFALSGGLISLIIPVFLVIALIIALYLLVGVWRKNKAARKNFLHFLFFLVLIPIYILIYVHAPYTYIHMYPNVRYALPVILLGLLMLGKITAYKKVFLKPMVFFMLFSFFAYVFFVLPFQSKFLNHTNDYLWFDVSLVLEYPEIFLLLVASCFSFLSFLLVFFRRKWWLSLLTFIVMMCFVLPFGYYSSLIRDMRGYHDEFLRGEQAASVLDAYEWADNNIADNARIAFTSVGSHYHLYGKNFTRDVSYVNINDCTNCLYHDFKDVNGSILANPSFENWMKNLELHRKDYLVVGWKYFDDDPFELLWARAHPEHFELLFHEENTYVFRINYVPLSLDNNEAANAK